MPGEEDGDQRDDQAHDDLDEEGDHLVDTGEVDVARSRDDEERDADGGVGDDRRPGAPREPSRAERDQAAREDADDDADEDGDDADARAVAPRGGSQFDAGRADEQEGRDGGSERESEGSNVRDTPYVGGNETAGISLFGLENRRREAKREVPGGPSVVVCTTGSPTGRG